MMRWHDPTRAGLVLAASLACGALGARAQARDDESDTGGRAPCTARSDPQAIRVESPATRVTARLPISIGTFVEARIDAGEGLRLSSAAELELMARSRDRPASDLEPATGSGDGRTVTLWLNTEDAEPGVARLTLAGDRASCAMELRIDGL